MSRKHIVILSLIFVLCSCTTTPSQKAVQTAIAQTANAEQDIPDSMIQTAIAKTQTASEPAATAQPETDQDVAVSCELSTPYHADWAVSFCDTFSDNRNGWELGSGSDDLSRSIYSIEDGKLVVDLTGKATSGYLSGVIQWLPVIASEDFVITLKGDVFSDYKSCSWGIVFNEWDNANFYAFMISSRVGTYSLTKFEDGDQDFPIPGKSHGAITWDDENELTIVAENGYYQFFINGTFVDDYETRNIKGTTIALATWTGEGVTARFEFDDLLIKTPESKSSNTNNLITYFIQ
ncbi:MAG TPA: hypothetical protein PLL88_11690 [Anaerolineaceae bacterium]|jgi:hypothetical protein|nr:hypothetical protein [Anaerolineaceae bacterium]